MKIGVVGFGFRDFSNGVEEIERLDEVLHGPVFANALVVIRQPPLFEALKLLLSEFLGVGGNTTLARFASFCGQLLGGLNFQFSFRGLVHNVW